MVEVCGLWRQTARIQIPVPPLARCATLGKSCNVCVPHQSPWAVAVPHSQGVVNQLTPVNTE